MDIRWITAFVDRGPDGFDAAAHFWPTISASALSPWRGDDDEFATLLPSDGADAHLRLQRTQSGASGSHIDLHVTDVRASTVEAMELGATVVADHGGYVILTTPGNMPFCIVAHRGEAQRQKPVGLSPGESASLIDQVSIDCDPDRFDDEVRFWTSITGWEPVAARAPEFVPLARPPAMPLRVMLQQRSRPVGLTSCHLDVACADMRSTVRAHERLGAAVVAAHDYWTVMSDPWGAVYCLTRRQPNTGSLPPVE